MFEAIAHTGEIGCWAQFMIISQPLSMSHAEMLLYLEVCMSCCHSQSPVMNKVMPFMIAMRTETRMELLFVKMSTVKAKLMFMRPRHSHTASRAASLCCIASRM